MLARNPAPMHAGDRVQAEYFVELLGRQRDELGERLDTLQSRLAKLSSIGDEPGVRRMRNIIRALEGDGRTIDRMRNALQFRLFRVGTASDTSVITGMG